MSRISIGRISETDLSHPREKTRVQTRNKFKVEKMREATGYHLNLELFHGTALPLLYCAPGASRRGEQSDRIRSAVQDLNASHQPRASQNAQAHA